MSAPNPKAEWYDLAYDCVSEYCDNFCGQPYDAHYYYEMLKNPAEQKGWMWDCFCEFVNDVAEDLQSKHQYQ